MSDANITPTAKPVKQPKPEMTEAEIAAFAKDEATQAVFAKVGEIGASAGAALDSQPALAIEVATAVGNGTIAFQAKTVGRGAKKNIFDAIAAKYVAARQSAASYGAKGESAGALVSRIQKVGEAAHIVKDMPDNNRSFADMLHDAIAHRNGRKDEKGIHTPFEFLYQIAQEQVRRTDTKKLIHSAPLTDEEISGLLVKPTTAGPDLPEIIGTFAKNLNALVTEDYKGHTVLAELPDGSANPVYTAMKAARDSVYDALEVIEQAQNATKAAADAKAKAEANAAAAAKAEADRASGAAAAEDERKAKIASLSEDDAMAQFMAEWKAARSIHTTDDGKAVPAPRKGRKAA